MQNSIIIFLLIFLSSCSSIENKEYNNPEPNPYPKIFKLKHTSSGPLITTRLKTKGLKLNCSLRTDGQPYYWCSLEGKFSKTYVNLPSKYFGVFHVQLPPWAVKNVRNAIRKIKIEEDSISIIIHRDPSEDEAMNTLSSQLFAFYGQKKCVAFLGMEDELCPKGSSFLNIYAK